MYGPEVRLRALELIESGSALRAISLSTGISRSTLREWRDHPERPYRSRAYCPRCGTEPSLPEPYADYAYLLGLYLGDGCISASGDPAKGVWKLRVMCADAWPGLVGECVRAMQAVRPANKVTTQQKQGCTEVLSHSRHWPCLFPQHGPGRKHSRTIELADWHQGEHHFGGEEGRRGAAGWVCRAEVLSWGRRHLSFGINERRALGAVARGITVAARACPFYTERPRLAPAARRSRRGRGRKPHDQPRVMVMTVQAPRWMRSPCRSGTVSPEGTSLPLTWIPFPERRSTTDQLSRPGPAISLACSRDTPVSVGGPARSISGS